MIKIGLTDYTPANKIITIKNNRNLIKAKYCIDKDDAEQCELMKEHYIEISFLYNKYEAFKRSDYIVVDGTEYYLREDHIPDQENKYKYNYTLKFEAAEMLFQDIQYYYRNQGLKEIDWTLTAPPDYFMQIGLKNINSYFGYEKFVLGTIEPTKTIFLSFSTDSNVFDSFTQIAEELEAEWYVTGNTIHLVNKVSFGDEVEFEVEKSILSMARTEGDSDKKITRLLALGSTRNLTSNYRKTETGEAVDAIYQQHLRIPISKGDVIDAKTKMSPTEVIEGSVVFEDVYPKRVGTIEAVGTIVYTDTNEETNAVTEWNAYKYKDSGLIFKKEYELPGVELRMLFTSGNLNGFDFALQFHDSGFSDTDDSQYFEIQRSDDYGTNLPNDILKPAVGDEYVLYGFNIDLVSDQYIPSAELELFETASKWIANNQKDTSVYDCPSSIQYFQENNMILEIGQRVKLIHDHFENGYRSSRIMGYKRNLNNAYNTTYIVGDNATYSRLSNMETEIKQLQVSGATVDGTKIGNGVYLIKQFDSTAPSDFNAYSAKASNAKYFNKQTGDVVQGNAIFNKNLKVNGQTISNVFQNETFATGAFGSGFRVNMGDNGQSYAEFDNLHVRREMVVETLTVAEINSVDGGLFVTCANMKCTEVEELETGYKCYFDTDDGTIPNRFKLDDQAISKIYEGSGIKYYWRLVTEVGENYIVLSKTDKDGSGIPSKNDKIIQFGNRTDKKRQTAQLISSYGDISAGIYRYDNVNSYDLTGKTTSYSNIEGTQITGNFIIQSTGKSVTDTINDIQIGNRNYLLESRLDNVLGWSNNGGNSSLTEDSKFGSVVQWQRISSDGEFQKTFNVSSRTALSNTDLVFYVIAKNINKGNFLFGGWSETYTMLNANTCDKIDLGNGWYQYWVTFKSGDDIASGNAIGLNSISGTWQFYAVGILKGTKPSDWSLAPEDIEKRISKTEATLQVLDDSIESKVSKQEFSTLDTKVTNTESKVEQLSDSITSTVEKVDNLKIGGSNFFSKNTWVVPVIQDGNHGAVQNRDNNGFTVITDKNNYPSRFRIGNVIKSDGWYTISGYVKSNNSQEQQIDFLFNDVYVGTTYVNSSYEYFEFSLNVKNYTSKVYNFIDIVCYEWIIYTFSDIKIEQGNKATSWTPATQDIQDSIDSKNSTFYSVSEPQAPTEGFEVGDIWYKQGLVDDCYETWRYTNEGWVRINVNVSKSKIEQTDERITQTVEKTGIDELGTGETLFSKINQTADEITLEVNKIQIGGSNTFTKSTPIVIITQTNDYAKVVNYDDNGFTVLNNKDYDTEFRIPSVIKSNGWYTFSGYIKGNYGGKIDVEFCDIFSGSVYFTDQWTKFSISFDVNNYTSAIYNFIDFVPAGWLYVYFKDVKVEQGNKATDWSPATEDIPEMVGSKLSLTDNKISLASKTIELDGNTIAKSISASDLDVGNGNFHVGADGILTAKGAKIQGAIESNSEGNRIIIDSSDRSIKLINQSGNILGKLHFYDFGQGFTPRLDLETVNKDNIVSSSLNMVPDTIQMTTPSGYYMSLNASGISFVKDSKAFSISVDITKSTLQLRLDKLPASKTGLRSGDVWRDGEYLKIVP